MIRINQLKLPIQHEESELYEKAAKLLRIKTEDIQKLYIRKQSLDARKKEQLLYIYTVDVKINGKEDTIVHKARNVNIAIANTEKYQFPVGGTVKLKHRPVIIGSGPAGLFCALMLARAGYCPIVLERGDEVDVRTKKVQDFWNGNQLDVNSNVQFGEGGAGTFSDGKLNTLVKDPVKRNQKVLELFVEFGSDPSILYKNKPHIGTDVLSGIVKNMRKEIIRLGGTYYFRSLVTDIHVERDRVTGVQINYNQTLETEIVILAVGHSARDTFEWLVKKNLTIRPKPFAVGLRIQHPQSMITSSQYGKEYPELLGAASYKVTHQTAAGRGVYSFCMCPGGYVVDASSEKEMLAVNGMSNHARDGENANSALIVTVNPEDFGHTSVLGGVEFQRKLERLAYRIGDGKIPVQLYGDFKANRISRDFGDVKPEFRGRYQFADLREMLPGFLGDSLIEGVESFDRLIHGFARYDAVFAGVETRTSSPIKIERNQELESGMKGLYPCGEGAGYAGGITSAAMDGIRIAEAIALTYLPI